MYDVCKNNCLLFRNEYAELVECPNCGDKRYIFEDLCTAAQRFTYLPLKPQLARMFGDSNIAQILQSHAMQDDNQDCIYDIHQSPTWKSAYQPDGIFKGDPRGISLALSTDGVNPFAHNRVHYSMWPLMLTLLNLPRRLRNKFSSIMLVGIVPGNGSQEPQSLDPFLDVLVDELLELSGCVLYDAYQKKHFNCKVELLLHVLGMCNVMSVVGSGGLHGCMFCNIQGQRNKDLNKTVYSQNRRFLPDESTLRKDNARYTYRV